jgi:hypothetical protein
MNTGRFNRDAGRIKLVRDVCHGSAQRAAARIRVNLRIETRLT